MTNYDLIKNFHLKFSRTPDPVLPDIRDPACRLLRAKLIFEEFQEVIEELAIQLQVERRWDREKQEVVEEFVLVPVEKEHISLRNLGKELADLLYVTYGTAAAHGLPINDVYADIHQANMSKLAPDGTVIRREDGKVLKGPNYKPATVEYLPE